MSALGRSRFRVECPCESLVSPSFETLLFSLFLSPSFSLSASIPFTFRILFGHGKCRSLFTSQRSSTWPQLAAYYHCDHIRPSDTHIQIYVSWGPRACLKGSSRLRRLVNLFSIAVTFWFFNSIRKLTLSILLQNRLYWYLYMVSCFFSLHSFFVFADLWYGKLFGSIIAFESNKVFKG